MKLKNCFTFSLCLICILLHLSCSKDNDLLSEYVSIDSSKIDDNSQFAVDDIFFMDSSSSIVLDVLANDNLYNGNNIKIISVSEPKNGIVIINNDNTLTYTPNTGNTEAEEPVIEEPATEDTSTEDTSTEDTSTEDTSTEDTSTEDTSTEEQPIDNFTYDIEVQNEDNTTTTSTGNVIVNTSTTDKVSEDVAFWQRKFDQEFNDPDNQVDSIDATQKSESANENQEYYFLAYYLDAHISMWQATGEYKYLDNALKLIENTINDAQPLNIKGKQFLGWPTNPNHPEASAKGYPLWESFMFRFVSSLLRVMHKSPNLRSDSNIQKRYETILNFTIENIWNKWEHDGIHNMYRINTHMSSHWARIGMDLYLITGESKYKLVFDNISHGTMIGWPSNLKNQIKTNSEISSALVWNQNWTNAAIQDTSHAGAIVSFWVAAYENSMYWDKNHIDGLISTLKNVIWTKSMGDRFTKNVDGTGGYDYYGRLHEWLHLGRFDSEIQQQIKENYTGANLTYYGIQPLGIAALNAKILLDGAPVYPEQ
ncbi:Ig-like domain-containing protein [Maribacter sedimenticola]|nr:Ig-like domain-containing protein [Maribacter sedimenticola]